MQVNPKIYFKNKTPKITKSIVADGVAIVINFYSQAVPILLGHIFWLEHKVNTKTLSK